MAKQQKTKTNFSQISGWQEKKLKCQRCGTDRNVKYKIKNKSFCNRCILKELK